MHRRADILTLTCGLVLSLLLHALLIVPSLIRSMGAEVADRPLHARFNPQDFEPSRIPPPSPEVPLGIDAKTPSTFTWVGYEEYQEHLVRLSELEQAAFTPDPAPTPGEPSAAAAASPVGEPVSGSPPEAMVEAEVEAPEPAVPPSTVVEASLRTLRQWLDLIDLQSIPDRLPDLVLPGVAEDARDDALPQMAMGEAETEESQAPPTTDPQERATKARDEPDQDAEKPPSSTGESASASESEPRPAGASGEPGEVADKESDPTTTLEVPLEDIKLGRPIARPGLEVKPRRPHFTLLTRLTASPSNPVVEVRFKRDGIPDTAEVVKSSGNATVDHAVKTSLYRWRASGEQLDELGEDQTLDIRIVIVLR